ncbi:MAG: hypothetical protein HEP71_27645 [Roseivirga sp.]|nr:hypothetical protein [Roseivirga sp.]
MKLSHVKNSLASLDKVAFQLPNGSFVPQHFHVTEVGVINKRFIDCGGTLRNETVVNFQLWEADDYDHRLAPKKLNDIIQLSEEKLGIEDWEIEVEYQGETIGKYGLDFNGSHFLLVTKMTDCLAKDNCGIPEQKPRIRMSALGATSGGSCAPGSGCC